MITVLRTRGRPGAPAVRVAGSRPGSPPSAARRRTLPGRWRRKSPRPPPAPPCRSDFRQDADQPAATPPSGPAPRANELAPDRPDLHARRPDHAPRPLPGASPVIIFVVDETSPLEVPLRNTSYPTTDWLSVEGVHDNMKPVSVMFDGESEVGAVGGSVSPAESDGYNLACGMTCCDWPG